jgi:hypothetical protein
MKTCKTCTHAAYHPRDGGECVCDECLGTNEEVAKNGGAFLYKNYTEGDPILRRIEAERTGECNIVIGGSGEHEVNVKWDINEAYKHLAYVCENCGFCVTHHDATTLELVKSFEAWYYRLYYVDGKLSKITRLLDKENEPTVEKTWWLAHAQPVVV